jgi:hypothetical protein
MSNIYRPTIRAEFRKKIYEFPEELSERWQFLTTKLIYAEQENFEELLGGYNVVFNCEFKQYESKS